MWQLLLPPALQCGGPCPSAVLRPLAAQTTPQARARRGTRAGSSLDNFVRPREYRLRDRQAERLGGLEVDDQLEFRGLLDREIGRVRSSEKPVHIRRDSGIELHERRAI